MVYFKEIFIIDHLFLLVNIVSLCICGLLGPDTVQTLEGAGLTDGLERLELGEVLGDGHGAAPLHHGLHRHHLPGQLHRLGHLLGTGVSLAGLLGAQWEQDQLALVLLQPLGVQLQGLNALVPENEEKIECCCFIMCKTLSQYPEEMRDTYLRR